MSSAPAPIVDGVARQGLPFGLFSVLSPRPSADAHWQNGVTWESLGCEPASGIGDPNCEDPSATTGLPKSFKPGVPLGEASPFTVYGSYVCSPVGHSIQFAQDQATLHLLAREEGRVEQALWTGDLDNGGFAPDADSLGTGVSISEGVGLLEQWIAQAYGSLGVIHMTRTLATIAAEKQILFVKGSTLYTALGTPVVAGGGYPGTSPAGAEPAAGTGYLYATPALLGYRSDVFPGASPVEAGFDKTNNDLDAVAERTYVIGYDPCGTAVVEVTFGSPVV